MKLTSLLCIAAALLLSSESVADDAEGSYFAVIVNDVDVSVSWYESTFGLSAGEKMVEAGRYEIVNLRKPGLFVELLELDGVSERPDRAKGFFKAGFLTDDLDAFIASLPEHSPAPQIIADTANGLRLIQLKDPDGNTIQIMQIETASDD